MKTGNNWCFITVAVVAASLFLLAAAPASATDTVTFSQTQGFLSKGPAPQTIQVFGINYHCDDPGLHGGSGPASLTLAIGQGDAVAFVSTGATCPSQSDGTTVAMTATQITKRRFHAGPALANATLTPCSSGCTNASTGDVTIQLVR